MRGGRLLALLSVVALLAPACASTSSKSKGKSHAGAAGSLAPRAFFWEARAANGAQLFLLGSVHIGDGRELVLDPRIEADWTQAQELVVELDTTSMSPIDAVDATNRFGLLPRGTQLRDVVRPETYMQVQKYMKAHDYSMERVDRMRPWLVAQVVTQLEYAAAGLDAENGVDVAMMRRAAGRKGIVPLETIDEQASLFMSMPPAMQETMLLEILREAQALLAVTRATLAAWEQGDEPALGGLLFGNASQDPGIAEFYERVFYSRNRSMTDRLVALAADGRPRFVVVGTGHLIGDQGIPQLLAQRGFQVERVGSAHVERGTVAQQKPATGAPAPATPGAPAAAGSPAPAAASGAPASASPASAAPAPTAAAPAPAASTAAPAPSAPIPVSPARPTAAAPTAPVSSPPREVHEEWLLQDAQPAAASTPSAAPAPEATDAPAAQPAPAPAPAPAKPKPKSRTSRGPKP